MTPKIVKKILISDAKVPLHWIRNKKMRAQPFMQNRVHNICKIFQETEIFYIKSAQNPSDLGTKFDKFRDVHRQLGEESLFRNGPQCLQKGIEAAIKAIN